MRVNIIYAQSCCVAYMRASGVESWFAKSIYSIDWRHQTPHNDTREDSELVDYVANEVELRKVSRLYHLREQGFSTGIGADEVYKSVDDALIDTTIQFDKVDFLPSPSSFEQVELPSGSGRFPFACPQWIGRVDKNMKVLWDPEMYGYTGGSTAALRSKWFNRDADDFAACTFLVPRTVHVIIIINIDNNYNINN
jgi:hypothetical protein